MITKVKYTRHLNILGNSLNEESFIIGGNLRKMKYGDAIRKYDPIAFNVGFYEWKLKFK